MIKKKTIKVYFLVIFFLSACRGKEVEIPLDFVGERLVLWGKLESGKSAQIQVNKIFPALGNIPEQTAVTAAEVSLFKNGFFYANLFPTGEDGFYGTDSLIEAGQTYRVRAIANGFPIAESDEVTVPASLPLLYYIRKPNVPGETWSHIPQDLVSITFNSANNLYNTYLAISFLAFFQDYNRSLTWPTKDNILANEGDCHSWTRDPDKIFGQLFLMNGACLLEEFPLNFSVPIGDLSRPPNSQGEYELAKRVTMLLASVSKEWFLYNQIENKQPEGLDHLVLPPQKAYTNVKNGYGIIYGYHAMEIELK